jgi:hypothetical protein
MPSLFRPILTALLLVAAMVTYGQGTVDTYTFNAEEMARKLSSMLGDDSDAAAYESSLRRLEQAGKAFSPEEAEKVLEVLKSKEVTIDQAEAQFDQMIKDIETTQALGDPDGEFVAFMNDMQLKAADEAKQARDDGATKYAESFDTLSAEFVKIRNRAIEASNEAIPAIDFLKQNKRNIVRAIKLRTFTEIALIADQTVEKVEKQSQLVQSAATDLRKAVEGTAR